MSVSSWAVAQPEAAAGTSAASAPSESAAASATKAEPSSAGEAAAGDKALPDKEEAAKEEAAKEEAAKAPPPKPEPAAKPAAEVEPAPAAETPVSVEILPGSGYPAPRVRGIVGGSLWLTMHGHQFPYMPAVPGKPPVRIAVSGSVWGDTSYARLTTGSPDTSGNMKRWANQTRGVLRATPTYSTPSGWFAQGQVELVASGDQYVKSNNMGGVDDVWVRAGKWNVFDIAVGRYQGWEVYHYGMGLDLNTLERQGADISGLDRHPPQIYGLSDYWDRPDGGVGNYAGHVYFTDYLRLEVLGQIGTVGDGSNGRAVRPVGVLDLGYLKVKAGAEYGVSGSQFDGVKIRSSVNGFGGSVQFVLDPHIEGGINGAIRYRDEYNKDDLPMLAASTTTKSFGGFLNGRPYGDLLLGVGANMTIRDSLDTNPRPESPDYGLSNEFTHLQAFFAVQYGFWDKLFLKFVGSYAQFEFEDNLQDPPHSWGNEMYSGRLRMMYLF